METASALLRALLAWPADPLPICMHITCEMSTHMLAQHRLSLLGGILLLRLLYTLLGIHTAAAPSVDAAAAWCCAPNSGAAAAVLVTVLLHVAVYVVVMLPHVAVNHHAVHGFAHRLCLLTCTIMSMHLQRHSKCS